MSWSRDVEAAVRHPGWPVVLGPVVAMAGEVVLRPLRRRDGAAWRRLRIADEALIARWDATSPLTWADRHSRAAWQAHRSALAKACRRGEAAAFAIEVAGEFAGQITLGGIQRGAVCSCWVGYWVSSTVQRKGVATTAVRLLVEHALDGMRLHRVEATIAPENVASLGVVRRLGFRQEGLLRRYLDVGGGWRDHLLFAITVEELVGGRLPGAGTSADPSE